MPADRPPVERGREAALVTALAMAHSALHSGESCAGQMHDDIHAAFAAHRLAAAAPPAEPEGLDVELLATAMDNVAMGPTHEFNVVMARVIVPEYERLRAARRSPE